MRVSRRLHRFAYGVDRVLVARATLQEAAVATNGIHRRVAGNDLKAWWVGGDGLGWVRMDWDGLEWVEVGWDGLG